MKNKILIAICALLLAVPVLAGCAAPAATLSVSCDDFQKNNKITAQTQVTAGQEFSVYLCSNATTGYSWSETATISDASVISQTSHEFIAPDSKSPIVGAPGTEKWTFKALKAGTASIKMVYGQPWEGGEKEAWTYTLNVTVK